MGTIDQVLQRRSRPHDTSRTLDWVFAGSSQSLVIIRRPCPLQPSQRALLYAIQSM